MAKKNEKEPLLMGNTLGLMYFREKTDTKFSIEPKTFSVFIVLTSILAYGLSILWNIL